MNKELGRKITSLTLMTIMLTWSAAMGFSSTFMPEAEAANEHLYVSAEAEGSFTKAQVIEIVVSEGSIADLDTAYGMPDVSINGSSIIMAQAVDGSWYAYVADADSSNLIDSYYVAACRWNKWWSRLWKIMWSNNGTSLQEQFSTVSAGNATSLTAIRNSKVYSYHFSLLTMEWTADGTSGYSAGDTVD